MSHHHEYQFLMRYHMNMSFSCKPTPALIFGMGYHRKLPDLVTTFGKNLLLVVGGTSFLHGNDWPLLQAGLKELGVQIHIEQIEGEPSPQLIDAIWTRYPRNSIDCVLAIGGGSVLDGGKAISAMLMERKPVYTFLEGVGTEKPSGAKVPFIAVPTTSGTGSEATSNAVLSQIGKKGFKKSLRHDNYVPNIAVIDPALTTSCPPGLTAACGMDTFSQLVEAYLSNNGSPFTDALALDGIRAVARSLPVACRNGADLTARADMSYGSYLSGIVLANAGLGVVHGMASALGGFFAIPHGAACALLMAPANRLTLTRLRENGSDEKSLSKYSQLGEIIADCPLPAADGQDRFIGYLEELAVELGIGGLHDFGVTAGDIDRIIAESTSKYNPVQLEHADFTAVLKEIL